MLTASRCASARVPATASHEPERGAAGGEQQAFRQHLNDQPAPAGAKRHADRDLFLTRGGSREQQVRQIRADDQHHHADRAGEHPERQAKPAAHLFGQRFHEAGETVPVGMLAR